MPTVSGDKTPHLPTVSKRPSASVDVDAGEKPAAIPREFSPAESSLFTPFLMPTSPHDWLAPYTETGPVVQLAEAQRIWEALRIWVWLSARDSTTVQI